MLNRPLNPRDLFIPLILVLAISAISCGTSGGTTTDPDNYEREEEEGTYRARDTPPAEWKGGLGLAPIDGATDTLTFHIGSPFFLSLQIDGDRGCAPFNGRPFFFDASGSQLGWGFEEVADTLVLPPSGNACERHIMLSSKNSNQIPEGYYSLKVLIFIDEARQLYSDTLVVHAVRSEMGANALSYTRFLIEQILTSSRLLSDPETLASVFGDTALQSATSELYRAVIHYRNGDPDGAARALQSVAKQGTNTLAPTALATYNKLHAILESHR